MHRIGIFGGAFDPIHLGHLRVCEALLSQDLVDDILLLPRAIPPFRKAKAPLEHVRAMAQLAVQSMRHVGLVDDAELLASSDTLESLKAISANRPGEKLIYIIGADKLAVLLHWQQAQAVFELCDLAVFPREGYSGHSITALASSRGARAVWVSAPHEGVTSALVRRMIERYDDAQGMLPREVAHYIALHGLYRPDLLSLVSPYLEPQRLKHTLAVRDLAVDLAYHHGYTMQKAACAALLHDIAKGMSLQQMRDVAKANGLNPDAQTFASPALLHGPVAAALAKARFGIQDEDILGAVAHHTTGRAHMTGLELCVFVGDAAAQGRAEYPGLKDIRAAMWTDLNLAALLSLQRTQNYVRASGKPYSMASQQAMDDLNSRHITLNTEEDNICRKENWP